MYNNIYHYRRTHSILRKQENTRVLFTLSHTIINLDYIFTCSIGDLFHLYIVFNTMLYVIIYDIICSYKLFLYVDRIPY